MRTEVNINLDILTWAISRAGFELDDFTLKVPNATEWLSGKKMPTIKQLEDVSKKVYLPFGYFLLPEPPKETLPIPYFRTLGTQTDKVNINVYDTIMLLKQRQDWLKEYLEESGYEPLPYVGKYSPKNSIQEIVDNIRKHLGLSMNWASEYKTWQEALDALIQRLEDIGIIAMFNGIVENNTHRVINVEDCRGFVIVDKFAPFMFVNNSDSKAAQMFTVAHELAHIWIGSSAGFDFRKLEPAANPSEVFCDKIAAELLVPSTTFHEQWEKQPSIALLARYFKVSEIVIARRALDLHKMTKLEFLDFYEAYIQQEHDRKETLGSGGNFYATTRKRLGIAFSAHINTAVKSGKLLYRDAYKLTGLKGDTFQEYCTKHI